MNPASALVPSPQMAASLSYGVRLRTLVLIRWMAIFGQTAAVLFVKYVLGFELPLNACLIVIAASALINILIAFLLPPQRRASPWEATVLLGYDILQLTLLLGLTGGLDNPFIFFLIAPTTVAAAALPPRHTAALTGLTMLCIAALALVSTPLPWTPGAPFAPPELYRWGQTTAVLTGISFTLIYAWRVSTEEDRLRTALFATEAVLAREQQVAALGGLAAAAAHELGTPLATIQVTAKEMVNDLPKGSPAAEDAQLILSQAQRCREILKSLSSRPQSADKMHDRMTLDSLLEEAAAPHLKSDLQVTAKVTNSGDGPPPILVRRQEIVHALGAFIENAVSFATEQVTIEARWGPTDIEIRVDDDGPGFSEQALTRLGEPFVSEREPDSGGGMGLGFFIAKTLVERSGGRVSFSNRPPPGDGASVRVIWPRKALEGQVA
ncbi:MAG: ActS/PrrB/RegB family redox-sensitive histidine kinase [Caulobacterales bacterium]